MWMNCQSFWKLDFDLLQRLVQSPVQRRVQSAQVTFLSLSVRSPFLRELPVYSLSSMVTRLIFTDGALRLFGSRGGIDMSTSSPSTT